MFKWLFHILIFATSGKYQNKEKPLKRQRKLGLALIVRIDCSVRKNVKYLQSHRIHTQGYQ